MTSAKATIEIITKNTSDTKVYSGKMDKSGSKYTFKRIYTLPWRGNYYMKATMKCYKNGNLKDTIKKATSLVSY